MPASDPTAPARGLSAMLAVACGGAAGAALRYLVSGWAQSIAARLGAAPWPYGTLAVNVTGSFAVGFLAVSLMSASRGLPYRELVLVGLLGGFTTFSAFAFETFAMLNEGQRTAALLNILLQNGASLLAAAAGYRFAERLVGVTA